ncbi:MAG: hypothetical protein AAB801_02380 [Patescibacteria group bacterium]
MAERDDETDPLRDRELYEQQGRSARNGGEYDSGRSVETVLMRDQDPETVRGVLRDHLLKNETFITNGETQKNWRISHLSDILQDREEAVARPLGYLKNRGIVRMLDIQTQAEVRLLRGSAFPIEWNEQFMGMSVVGGHSLGEFTISRFVPESYGYKEEGGRRLPDANSINSFRKIDLSISYFGDLKEREEASKEFANIRHEMLARNLILESFGKYIYFREANQKLVESLYFGSALSNEGLAIVFNLPSREGAAKETATGVKVESLGRKIATAYRLYLLNSRCEKTTRFRETMSRPGFEKFLFPKNPEQAELIKKWLGEPNGWEKEALIRKPDDTWDKTGTRTSETLAKERRDGKRGKLTQKNIFAEGDTYFEGQLHDAIEEFIGGKEGATDEERYVNKQEAETARRIAYRFFRLSLSADVEGIEIYKRKDDDPVKNYGEYDPFPGYEVSFENGPAASDLGKEAHPWAYIWKSYGKGRDFSTPTGLLISPKLFSRLAVDFFHHIYFKCEINTDKGIVYEDRSIDEVMWGNEAGGVSPSDGGNYLEEKPVDLPDIPWTGIENLNDPAEQLKAVDNGLPVGGLHSEIMKNLYLTCFMAGREGGVFDLMQKTDVRIEELLDEGWWLKFWKMLDVGIKKSIALEGEFKGVSKEEAEDKLLRHKLGVVEGFLRSLHSTVAWESVELKNVDPYYRKRTTEKKSNVLVKDRLLEVVNAALAQEIQKAGSTKFKTYTWDELLKGKTLFA